MEFGRLEFGKARVWMKVERRFGRNFGWVGH